MRRWCAALLLGCLLLTVRHVAADDDDEDDDDDVEVTCGSLIKLEAEGTKHVLHSHEVSYGYGRGSGQQSVTAFPERDSGMSLWALRVADCPQGTPIKRGQEVRLQHMGTRRWLHSHHFTAPLSNNQEVSAFGDDNTSDYGDVWVVEPEGSATKWMRDAKVTLRHPQTGVYLSNHNVQYQRPIPGHTEVYGAKTKGSHALWRATEGVYFPARKAAIK